jgi:hypothetical protein
MIIFRLRWSRGRGMAFSTEVRRFIPSRSRRIFRGEKILSRPSFGVKVNSSLTCRSFAAYKRSLNNAEVVISVKLPDNNLAHSYTFRCGHGGTWRRKWERLKARKSNGKLPLRTFPENSETEPYRSPDWALVSAELLHGLNTNDNEGLFAISIGGIRWQLQCVISYGS